MKIKYSQHLVNRLAIRGIADDIPRKIVDESGDRYRDQITGHYIATMKIELHTKLRELMVAYAMEDDGAVLLTIHPLKEGQKENRINAGRWRKI